MAQSGIQIEPTLFSRIYGVTGRGLPVVQQGDRVGDQTDEKGKTQDKACGVE
jgi:hypothetical protein